jgi:hypothetical protein
VQGLPVDVDRNVTAVGQDRLAYLHDADRADAELDDWSPGFPVRSN